MRTAKYNFALFLLATLFVNITIANSQNVGINTTTPRTTLEVAGDVEIYDNIQVGKIDAVTDSDSHTFLVQRTNDRIASLSVSNPTDTALGYIQEYIITNADEDWVLDFNTGIPANEYVLITTSASFDTELILSTSTGAEDNASLPYTATFVQGNKWHIIADYPMAANDATISTGTWIIKTLIYSKDLSKQFGNVNIPMAGASTGSATAPIID